MQAHIQAIKKTASKGDKKKKKEVGDEITRMTEEMEVRHKRELEELKASDPVAGVTADLGTSLNLGQDAVTAADEDEAAEGGAAGNAAVRVSKAQKRRDAKARKEKERREEIERQGEENKFGARQVEIDAITARLKAK